MPQPIDTIRRDNLPQSGRIRMGTTTESRNGKTIPTSSDTWILTSSRPEDLSILAEVYGGQVERWEQDRSADSHRLVTETNTLDVILHSSALGEPRYELWKGSQIQRRCDGRICTGYPRDAKGNVMPPMEVPCLCNQKDADDCKPKTHLSLLLPQVPLGVWRLVTSSSHALRELFGSVEVLRAAQSVGLPVGQLRIDKRQGEGKKYSVPVLSSRATMHDMLAASNGGTPVAINAAPTPTLPELASVQREDDPWR